MLARAKQAPWEGLGNADSNRGQHLRQDLGDLGAQGYVKALTSSKSAIGCATAWPWQD